MGVTSLLLSAVATWWLLGYKGELMYAHLYNRDICSAFIRGMLYALCYVCYKLYAVGYLLAIANCLIAFLQLLEVQRVFNRYI